MWKCGILAVSFTLTMVSGVVGQTYNRIGNTTLCNE